MKRIIPVLLIKDGGLVKSFKFRDYRYVGDPINAVKIFNEKQVDEIIILDISASKEKRVPNISMIAEIAGEAFMPLAYGGGITSIEQVRKILYEGVEKVVFNTSALFQPSLIEDTARCFGSSSTVVSIDVGRNFWRKYKIFASNGRKNTGEDIVPFVRRMVDLGAGEIFLNVIERDGTYSGFDIPLIKMVSSAVQVPVIACGGAGSEDDLILAIREGGASAAAAGSLFVFQQPHRAVLISYPSWEDIQNRLKDL